MENNKFVLKVKVKVIIILNTISKINNYKIIYETVFNRYLSSRLPRVAEKRKRIHADITYMR